MSEIVEAKKKNGKNLAEFFYSDFTMENSPKEKRAFLCFITSRV